MKPSPSCTVMKGQDSRHRPLQFRLFNNLPAIDVIDCRSLDCFSSFSWSGILREDRVDLTIVIPNPLYFARILNRGVNAVGSLAPCSILNSELM